MESQHPTEYLPGYILEALDTDTYVTVREHVTQCRQCQQELDIIKHELFVADAPPMRPMVKTQVMQRVAFDVDIRSALHEAARRTSLRWFMGAFLLICGSILASLLMWSGMDQRAQLAQDSTMRREVAYTQSAAIARLLSDQLVVRHAFIGYDGGQAQVLLYAHPVQGVLVVGSEMPDLSSREYFLVWRIATQTVEYVGRFGTDDQGVAWMLNDQIDACAQSCRYWITREREPTPVEPNGVMVYEVSIP